MPMGGETCDYHFLTDPDADRLECESALDELSRFHWSFLNLDWYKPTLQQWLHNGCLPEIEERLGYRFVLLQGTYDETTRPGGDFRFDFQIRNEGFAAPYNPRDVELVLRGSEGAIFGLEVDADPRFWLPGEVHTISGTTSLPETIPVGDYELLLNLPDPEPRLRNLPEYSIRLANEDIWESETGYNKLNRVVTVIEGTSPPVEKSFASIPAEDGWVRESSESSGVGGRHNTGGRGSQAIRIGDNKKDRQFKSILSFDASSIPDGATITGARLELMRGGNAGQNPFNTHGPCYVDIKSGGFSGNSVLQNGDFQAPADAEQVATVTNQGGSGTVYGVDLDAAGGFINKAGKTQLRLYFALDDNDDRSTDIAGFYSADNGNAGHRPRLVVTYEE